jgi:hypothetical protein
VSSFSGLEHDGRSWKGKGCFVYQSENGVKGFVRGSTVKLIFDIFKIKMELRLRKNTGFLQ